MDIRLQTAQLRWSSSPWDAWITRKMYQSAKVAERVGGVEMLFNPVAGQLRKLRRNNHE